MAQLFISQQKELSMQMKTDNKITTKPLVIVGIVLITILLFCLVGCNNNVDNTPPTPNPPEPPHTHSYNANGICSCGQTRSIEVSLYIDGKYEKSIYTDSDCNYKITLPSTPEDIRTNPNSERYFYGWFADPNFQTPVTNKTTFNTNTKIYAKWITVYSNSFSYTVDYGKATITGYVGGTPTVLVIPAFINSFPVKKIGVNAFENETVIRTVIICDGIEEISGFKGCNSITEISIPDSVKTIGESCFEKCGFTKINIPDSVTTIKSRAFYGNRLTSFNAINVTSIEAEAFSKCYLLKNVEIPNVTYIGKSALEACDFTKIDVPKVTFIDEYAFKHCENLTTINIPNVKTIGKSAFDFAGLTSITLPNTLETIEEGVFHQCKFEEIIIPKSVKSINYYAFARCKKLKKIVIPETVEFIGKEIFGDCTGLEVVTWPSNIKSIPNYTFSGCTNLRIINNFENINKIGNGAFIGCSSLGNISLPLNITYIAQEAFYGCKNISMIIPSSVKSINGKAFYGCENLTLTIPKSVTYIGAMVFYKSKNVKIYYQGSESQWLNISKGEKWKDWATNLTITYEE